MERYLAESIDSALAQTWERTEVVVVDDGSTDSTPDIIRSYGDRIKVVTQPNRGLAAARNTAIRASSGEVIALLDADDVWTPGRLTACVAALRETPDAFVTTDAYLIDDTVRTERHFYGDFLTERTLPPPADQLEAFTAKNYMFVSVVFPRTLLDRVGLFDERLRRAEDYDMWLRFLLAGGTAKLVPEALAWYRCRPDSLRADVAKQWVAHLFVLEQHLPAIWSRGVRARSAVYFQVARSAARGGRRAESRRFVAMGLRTTDEPISRRLRSALNCLRTSSVAAP